MTSQSYIRSSAVARWSACGLGCHFVSVEWRSPLTTLTLRGRSQEESGASCRGDSESKISLVGVFGAGCSDTFQVTFYSGWVYFWTINWKYAARCCGQDYSETDFSSFVSCQVLKQCIFISRIQWVHGCVSFTAFPRSLVLFPLTSLHQMCLQKRGWCLAGDAEDTLAFVGPFGSITRASRHC